MRELIFHIILRKKILDFELKSGIFSRIVKTILLFCFFSSFVNAQIYVTGGVEIVGAEQIHSISQKIQASDSSTAIYVTEGTIVTNLDQYKTIPIKKNIVLNAQVGIGKINNSKKAFALKEKISRPKKVVPIKKNLFHCKPLGNLNNFLGAEHQYKTFNLPTEHSYKTITVIGQDSIIFQHFSSEKTKILTAEFFNTHTFASALYTRPPPVKF